MDNLDFYIIKLVDESGQYVEINLREELAINEDNLSQEMLQQPSKYVYWSSVLEKIRLFQENADLEMELLLGELDKEARIELPKEDIKPTKDSVDGYIKRTEKYKIAKEKCNYYDYLVKRLQFIVRSFEQRKDMIQSFGKQKSHDYSYGRGAGSHFEKFPNQQHPPQAPYNQY